MNRIRLVTFDILHTLITPRQPIHVQYSQVFAPYLGVLPPDLLKQSFETVLKSVQIEHPSYAKGADLWWEDVIRRTALRAGANKQAVDGSLSEIVPRLMKIFSSKEGYKAFDDAIPTIQYLHEQNVRTAAISNGDYRLRTVLSDLEFPDFLKPVVLSEEQGAEKPSRDIFLHTLELVNRSVDPSQPQIHPGQCLHVGDELLCDYGGAIKFGWNAVLLRRPGADGEQERKDGDENLENVKVVDGLDKIRYLCGGGLAL